jgi:hypothetical protein
MDVTGQSESSAFIGWLFGTIIVAVPIALLVSLALLRIYRRAVLQSMQGRVTPGTATGVLENRPARSGEPPEHPLEITPHDAPADGVRRAVRRATWPSAAVEVCAGLAYAIVMASSWVVVGGLYQWHKFLFEWHVFLLLSVWSAWPMVITVGLATAVSWRGFAMLVAAYALALAGVAAPILVSTGIPAEQLLKLWLRSNGPSTLLALAFLARPIRAVGLLVLVFMIAAVGGAVVILISFNQHQQIFYWIYRGIFYGAALLTLTGLVGIGIIGWLLLRWFVTGVTAEQVLTNWLNANAIDRLRPLTLARPISGVVVVFVIATVGGTIVMDDLFHSDEQQTLLWLIIRELGVVGNIVLLLLAGAVPAGIIGWLLLRWLGSLYRARRISDQSIMIDAVWLMFSFMQSPLSSAPLEVTGATTIGAFVAYKLAATTGYRLLHTGAKEDTQPFKLLLLRVFSLGSRSERMFAGFTKLWRHMGSVRMIAGPDLATSTVEPHEFLDFLAGRLQRRFISGPDTLEQRLRETEPRRDGDGRFRIADFFCHDDTWQMVLRRLEKDTDVVLMDLRGFSPSNRGCVFEIKELLDVMLLRHIVFVVDRTTDEPFLAQVFADAWATLTNASPNWNDPAPRVRLYRCDGHVGQNIPALVAVVANAGMHYRMRTR